MRAETDGRGIGHYLRSIPQNYLFPADLDDDFSAARAVELAKEYTLPGTELQGPILNQNLFAAADQRAFAVRIGIAFGMSIARTMLRQQLLERQKQVVRNGRVGILIYGNRGGRVGTINNYIAVGDAASADKRADLAGNINHLTPRSCTYTKLLLNDFHCGPI